MRWTHFAAVSVMAATLSLAAGFASGEDDKRGRNAMSTSPTISLEEAVKVAKAQYPGRVVEAELEDEDGKPVYEIEIVSAAGQTREFEVDAMSGKVTDEEMEDAEADEEESGKD